LRQPIDYGFSEAHTVYGIIGVKVWLCKKAEQQEAPAEKQPAAAPAPAAAEA
jgi:small subunit ribosomal protein S3